MDRISDLLANGFDSGDSSLNRKLSAESAGQNNVAQISTIPTEAHSLWEQVGLRLEKHLNPQIFTAWIKPLTICEYTKEQDSLSIALRAPNKFCAQHIKRNYLETLKAVIQEISLATPNVDLRLIVSASHNSEAGSEAKPKKQAIPANKLQSNNVAKKNTAKPTADSSNLISHYNFSNFVVGGCNQFAHAVSMQVSENLGSTYNPLFIYGGVGLGKTHLANAIGNASRRRNKKVLLVSSETFVSELISSLRSNTMDRFKNKFRSLDLLIIDDIQFIIGKERTQEEFFHTFNELYNHNKQIIVTCDKVPQELIGLEDRLRTRFACGVSADLQVPDYETRVAILIKKAQTRNINLSDAVARTIAERIDTNVRELEGVLNRLMAMASLNGCNPTIELAQQVLKSVSPTQRIEVTTDRIQKVVAEKFNVSIGDILGKRRTHNIAFARQVAMYLCREHTGCSYPELGALFGGRDHSTVIHARKVITEKLKTSQELQDSLSQLQQCLRG
ncbi:UNVERIFIED_CONTAM: hypothetical protein GTU68_028711 [Idotea baltica]|nr:hypothetical protein [Idotea baltica]